MPSPTGRLGQTGANARHGQARRKNFTAAVSAAASPPTLPRRHHAAAPPRRCRGRKCDVDAGHTVCGVGIRKTEMKPIVLTCTAARGLFEPVARTVGPAWARDQAGGALCSVHVPRTRPAAKPSSFTSLRRAPHRPDLQPSRLFNRRTPTLVPAKAVGWPTQRSKGGGAGAARPGGHERSRPPGGLGPRGSGSAVW